MNDVLKELECEEAYNIGKPNAGICDGCGYEPFLYECTTEVESDGWEYPDYIVDICPKCGESLNHYFYKDPIKTKLIVGYSTNRDERFIKKFNKEIIKSSGLSQKKDEIIMIPFINNGEFSLTQSYNKILADTITKYIDCVVLFIHHDVHFKSQGWGKNILNIFNNNEVDILGLAGTDLLHPHCVWWLDEKNAPNQNNLWGKVWHTDGKKQWKSDFTNDKVCGKLQPVAVIDGVFIAFNPDTCIDFDEDFDGFHFYDISFCIENHIHGKKIAVTETIQLLHDSGGQLSIAWEENRVKSAKIYEQYLPIKI
jgi:hypothetical protein